MVDSSLATLVGRPLQEKLVDAPRPFGLSQFGAVVVEHDLLDDAVGAQCGLVAFGGVDVDGDGGHAQLARSLRAALPISQGHAAIFQAHRRHRRENSVGLDGGQEIAIQAGI